MKKLLNIRVIAAVILVVAAIVVVWIALDDEPIHTEYSYKYLESDVAELADNTGFEILDRRVDQQGFYCTSLWGLKKR